VKARDALLDLMYTPGWLATHTGPFNTIGDPDMPPHAKRGHFLASKNHDSWDACAKITARTSILHGGEDVFNPVENAALLAERIPDARALIIPGARHAYFEEFRRVASPLALDFLTMP
jgi:pimeloyl-ACP methyl ester carboxylesterase